jgi:acetyltransferase-like isoleucine patch superfamily enzyme
MELIHNLQKLCLEKLSDLEFKLLSVNYGDKQFFRTKYLQFMNIKIDSQVRMGHNIYIKNKGSLTLGKRCSIGSFTRIWNYAPISIGDDFSAAGGLTLNSATHDPITLQPKGVAIKIGDRVWCGVNVTIIAGVTIGDDVVIGAGSVVVKDLPSNCVAVGVPAKPFKELDREKVKLFTPFS